MLRRFWRHTKRADTFEFVCSYCGKTHSGAPSFSYDQPPQANSIPKEEWAERIKLNDDFCVIDQEDFFIRGLIEIPILGYDEPFLWGVWVSQSEESFWRYVDTFDQDQSGDGSFGWLSVTMPGYRRTGPGEPLEAIPCDVEWQGKGDRPLVFPQEEDHPLAKDMAHGISVERAAELAVLTMHGATVPSET